MKRPIDIQSDLLDPAADYYRRHGYEVRMPLSKGDLPPFVKSFRPDFVAIRGRDKLLVLVQKAAGTPPKSVPDALFDRLRENPEWTLEYYYVQGRRDVLERIEDTPALTSREIAKRASEARKLLSNGHREAALLLVWSALEAVMRNFAAKQGLDIRGGAEAISSTLVANGYLEHSHHVLFQRVVPIRNALVHGLRNATVGDEVIVQLIETVPVLQRELAASRRARAS
jgi:hypothetical protein